MCAKKIDHDEQATARDPEAEMGADTLLAHFAEERGAYHGAVVPPIFQNSLFTFDSWQAIDQAFDDRTGSYIYTRGQNPSVSVAEQKIARLAGGERAKLFASGMAAISAVILHHVRAGDHVVTVDNIYGPARTFLTGYLADKMDLGTTFVSGEHISDFEAALTDRTRLIYLESPSSAVFSLQDLAAVAELARDRGIPTVVDNTWATPIFQRPLELGIDFEVHSCSKYLGGHSDLVTGVVIGKEQAIIDLTVREYELLGGKMAPWEAWLLTRSLRTLSMRMDRHQHNALTVANFLENHPAIRRVRYPGLESHPQYELAQKQMTGTSGLLSFELKTSDVGKIRNFVNAVRVFQIGVSWGGHESLIYAPAISYLKELPPEQFERLGISLGDIRLSVGLENAEDLVRDLDRALEQS